MSPLVGKTGLWGDVLWKRGHKAYFWCGKEGSPGRGMQRIGVYIIWKKAKSIEKNIRAWTRALAVWTEKSWILGNLRRENGRFGYSRDMRIYRKGWVKTNAQITGMSSWEEDDFVQSVATEDVEKERFAREHKLCFCHVQFKLLAGNPNGSFVSCQYNDRIQSWENISDPEDRMQKEKRVGWGENPGKSLLMGQRWGRVGGSTVLDRKVRDGRVRRKTVRG